MACRNEISPGRSAGLEEDLARHPGTSPHIYTRGLELKGCVSGVSGWELARISHQLSWRGWRSAVPSGVFDPEARPEPPVPTAAGAREPRSRREEESMPEHRRRRATKRQAATPIGPKGCGAMAPPSSLPLLGDGGHRRRRGAWNPGPWRRNGRRWGIRPGLAGRGVVLDSTSSTPRRENPDGCSTSPAAAGS